MTPEIFSIGLLIIAAAIGFAGSFSANYLWWWMTSDRKKQKYWHHIVGLIIVATFLYLFVKSYFIFSKI